MNSERNSRRNAGRATAQHGEQDSGSPDGESQSTFSGRKFAGCLLLIVFLTALAYCRVPSFQYLNWDDNVYVVRRQEIHDGLTLSGLRWAFSTFEAANWHPLVWVSYMCEIEIFGIDSGAMHVVNLALHLANTALVAILIRRFTGHTWSGLAVAAMFGLHPQHVEAVAWISERKELLCVFFGLLALLAWQAWQVRFRTRDWIAAHVLFALSLLSKQMLVTLPFLMLVIEVFPLSRVSPAPMTVRRAVHAIRNKAGFFLLAFSSLAAAFAAQDSSGAIADSWRLPLWVRIANALHSIAAYVMQTFVPLKLSAFYRHPQSDVSVSLALLSLSMLSLLSLLVWRNRSRPGMVAGWLWFLGTLVPVLGIVQLGAAARADRYTYFPHIGLFLMLTAIPCLNERRYRRFAVAGFALCLLFCGHLTLQQTAVWHDSISLWQSVLLNDPDNYRAHEHLATALLEAGRTDEAAAAARIALRYSENGQSSQSCMTLGTSLLKSGQVAESVEHLRRAVMLAPDDGVAALHLAYALRESDSAESLALFERARTLDPQNIECLAGLANAEARRGNLRRSIALYQETLRISPGDERLKENLRIIEDTQRQCEQ